MRLEKDGIVIRELVSEDAELLLQWLTNPSVLEFYEGKTARFTIESVREKFCQPEEEMHRCIIEQAGAPIGYLQFYPLWTEEDFDDYSYNPAIPPVERPVYAMDQFIGIPELWGKGIGRRFVGMMQAYLLETQNVFAILLDPHADNERAIRCYESCGFCKVKLLPAHEPHDGEMVDCWLMRWQPKA